MDRIQQMNVFIQVVESGNFTRAAEALGVPRSTVSSTVQALEDRLGVQLLQRTTRVVRPTQEGLQFADTARGLVDGDRLSQGDGELEVFHTPGHTMGSLCFRYGNALFSGDHVLPKISPNVGGGDLRRQGMLRYYLDSLDRIAQLDHEDLTVSPGHGEPFQALRGRCEQLIGHHHHRLRGAFPRRRYAWSGPCNP